MKIRSIDDVKKYRTGVIRDDVGEQLLIRAGIEESRLERASKAIILIKILNAGKIDLWSYCENVATWLIRRNGFNPEDYETVYMPEESGEYYAFHKDTPDSLIRKFQNALDELKKKPDNGSKSEYERILDKYLK